jgi:hypothetical protein
MASIFHSNVRDINHWICMLLGICDISAEKSQIKYLDIQYQELSGMAASIHILL